ncbi:hypothetical protein DFH06DRAFT_1328458 [Mycena polygramma]|nr:hypothetical protein DFH06DRAFT_1328458 [Mycena polygramma]
MPAVPPAKCSQNRTHPYGTRSHTLTPAPSHSYATRSRDQQSPSKALRPPDSVERGARSSPSKPGRVVQSPKKKPRVKENVGERGQVFKCDDPVDLEQLLSPALHRRARLDRVNHALNRLQREKEVLTEQFQYSVLTLPVEITAEIFGHAVSLPSVGAGPPTSIVLSQVCRLWRAIALAYPILWSVIPVMINVDNLESMGIMVQILLARSWLRPRFVVLRYAPNDRDVAAADPFYQFLCSILRHSGDLEHLDIGVTLWRAPLRLLERPMPQLRHLTLWVDRLFTYGQPHPVVMSSATVPRLHSIKLHHFIPDENLTLPWAQLTILTCDSIQYRDLRSILLQTPALVHCAVSRLRRGVAGPASGQIIHEEALLQLESLSFTLYDPEDDPMRRVFPIAAMQSLPSLRILQVPETYLQYPSFNDLLLLVKQCRLEELHIIDRTYIPEQTYIDELPFIPSIFFPRQVRPTDQMHPTGSS